MQKWEYKILNKLQIGVDELNQPGSEGWELVQFDYDLERFFFKRPKQ